MSKIIQRFSATDDHGRRYRLLVWQEYVSTATRSDPSHLSPSMKYITTEDGESVNRLEKGQYEMAHTGVILRSSDPDAP
jgi:hypothetical protein